MKKPFQNVYEDTTRAQSYDQLEFHGTYYLAYRDLPAIINKHVTGRKALDFGCGAGRSTRFLKKLGFEVVGVDISAEMLTHARKRDPHGEYRLLKAGDLARLPANEYDLVLSAFPFDNIPTMELKVSTLKALKATLKKVGRIVNIVSSPEIYVNEWTSFSTKDFPGNRIARSGDKGLVKMLDVEDDRPVEDIIWSADDYHKAHALAGLMEMETFCPFGKPDEPYKWVSETTIAPWVIYVLQSA